MAPAASVRSIVQRALGTETAESLTRQLAEVEQEVKAALQTAERLEQERTTADNYSAAEELGRKAPQHRWNAERAFARVSELEQKLVDATTREKAAALARARTRWQALYRKLRDAVEAAAAVQAEVMAADAELIQELGENVVRTHLPALAFRGLILPDLVSLWRNELDRAVLGLPPADPPAPRVRRTSLPARPASGMQHGVAVVAGKELPSAPGSMHAPVAPNDDGPLLADHVRVVVLRGGFEGPDHVPSHTGRKIQLPRTVAVEAAKSGAVEIMKE